VRGFEAVRKLMDAGAAQTSEGEGYNFETIAVVETADLAYEVGIEHNRAKARGCRGDSADEPAGHDDPSPRGR
jgi:hypothetical protein